MALLRLSSFARTLRLSQFKFAPRSFAAAAGGSAKQIDKIINGNSAASYVAYGLSENIMIFPITPSSQMGDQVDAFAADGLKNCLGNSVKVVQMQSEGGAGGALHGCASSGALSSTFTCSQGLLLFIPNMYLLAGELTPAVFHVSARTLSKHALSIFGDHSDVMAVRSTGFSILSSANPQEVHDMAIVAHIAALNGSLPVLHFFDGFRTSHTAMNVKVLPYEEMRPIFPTAAVEKNLHEKALNSTRPMHRGTGQRTDIFMQNTIAGRGHFLAMPDIVQETMDQVAGLTGRQYSVFEYVGHPEAERVMVIMGSSAKTVRCTLGAFPGDEKVGMVNVRLYRPWDAKRFLDALPSTTTTIGVMDRTNEDGAMNPLYLDVIGTVMKAGLPVNVVNGVYGLASREFAPGHVKAVFDFLKDPDKDYFTIGIDDDVFHTSIPSQTLPIKEDGEHNSLLWGVGGDGTVGNSTQLLSMVWQAAKQDGQELHGQVYTVYDAHKEGGVTCSHLRFAKSTIEKEYLIDTAGFMSVGHASYLTTFGHRMIDGLEPEGTLLLNSKWSTTEEFEENVPATVLRKIAEKNIKVHCVPSRDVATQFGMPKRTAVAMGTGFMQLSGAIDAARGAELLKKDAERRFRHKGAKVIENNQHMIDEAAKRIVCIQYDAEKWAKLPVAESEPKASKLPMPLTTTAEEFVDNIMNPMLQFESENLPVSMMVPGGNQVIGSTEFERRGFTPLLPVWEPENCVQCNMCSIVCPHAVIRPFLLNDAEASAAPTGFDTLPLKLPPQRRHDSSASAFSIQVSTYDCTGCEHCAQACPTDALKMVNVTDELMDDGDRLWKFAKSLSPRSGEFTTTSVKGSQFQVPQFQFNGACSGCGETSTVKLLSQMYGPQLVLANSSGCSSVWSGLAGFSPFTKDPRGFGPAWGRSLFEDTAEYGYGLMAGLKQRRLALASSIEEAVSSEEAPPELQQALKGWLSTKDVFEANDAFSKAIEESLPGIEPRDVDSSFANALQEIRFNVDVLRPQQHWCMGGDGWAYDIGFGGLAHVLGLNEDINILVMDTECYANTGSQSSSATQISAVHKFAQHGKRTKKKSLSRIAMTYDNVYVAQICLGSNQGQAVQALEEAVAHPGPSLVVALTPCVDWGLQANEMMQAAKSAVDVGYWQLFRYDPKKGTDALTLDSVPRPDEDMLAYMLQQNRFGQLVRKAEETAATLHTQLGLATMADMRELAATASSMSLPAGMANPSAKKSLARESLTKPRTRSFSTKRVVATEEDGHIHGRPRDVYVNRPRPQWNALKCTQCLECVAACDQSALFPAWLPEETVQASQFELNTAPASDMPGTEFTFFVNEKCNGCADCVTRCDELFYGGCLEMVDDTNRKFEQHDLGVIAALGGFPRWDASKCTACGRCETVCPTQSIKSYQNLSEAKLKDISSAKTPDGGTYVLSISPSDCTSCQECVATCQNELGSGDSALAMVWDFGAKRDAEARHQYLEMSSTVPQLNEIVENTMLAVDTDTGRDVGLVKFYNPDLATAAESGLFLILMSDDHGERLPLTYADWDVTTGTVTMVVQNLGAGSAQILDMKVGSTFSAMVGPLGMKTHVEKYDPQEDGKVVIMAGGVGLAAAFPVIRAFKQGGNHVVSLLGFRKESLIWWADESEAWSDELVLMTDDGSAGKKGFVHLGLQEMIDSGEKIAEVWVCGPPPMMDAVVAVTRKYGLKTTVSLAPHMVDGTGMCGACRVEVDGQRRFACIHGPEFDGLTLNWDTFKARHRQYTTSQEDAKVQLKAQSECRIAPATARVPMREQPAQVRNKNWEEVTLGYTKEEAMAEAKRCIQCHNPTCVTSTEFPKAGCPVQVDIPGFIKQIAAGNFVAASEIIKRTNPMGAICGRVCPQEDQCEQTCIFSNEGEVQEPIAIGRLERFCSDYARMHASSRVPTYPVQNHKKVAVVGSGPAGIAAAGELVQRGYDVTVMEALHKVGGVLRYGIPEFRLPKSIIDHEVQQLERLGVKLQVNCPVGPLTAVPKLLARNGGEFEAVFLGVGAGAPVFLGIDGENANGVISANEFLTRIVLMGAWKPGASTPVFGDDNSGHQRIIVIGAGNTAMDVARSSMRMVGKRGGQVTMVYRRAMSESPSREEEIHHASDEGIQFLELSTPKRVVFNEDGWVTGLECSRMAMLETRGGLLAGSRETKKKRRDCVEVPDSLHIVPCDVIIPSIGTGSNEVLTRSFPELMLNKKGYILTDENGHTNYEGVWAGGDIVSGAATVIEAAGNGRTAAATIDEYLRTGQWPESAPKAHQYAKLG